MAKHVERIRALGFERRLRKFSKHWNAKGQRRGNETSAREEFLMEILDPNIDFDLAKPSGRRPSREGKTGKNKI